MLVFAACDEQSSYEETIGEEYPYDEDAYSEEVLEEYNYEEDSFTEVNEEYIIEEEETYIDDLEEQYQPEIASVLPVEEVITNSKWEEITDGLSFERTQKEKPKERKDPRIGNPGWNFGSGFQTGLSTVAWILVIAILVSFLTWLMVRSKVDTSVNKVRDFTVTDELLAASKEELKDALSQNLNRGDFQAAIRYRFGQLLQAMRKEGLLVWVPGRTNAEYQRNLQAPFSEPFGVLAKAFSFAIYSGKIVTRNHYDEFAHQADLYLELFSLMNTKGNVK